MPTTQIDIRRWFKEGLEQKATHMIVVCDTFDYGDFPVYVKFGEDVNAVEAAHDNREKMQRVMEVYNLTLDMESQIAECRSFHREPVLALPETPEDTKARERSARRWAKKKVTPKRGKK